jgi:hypothetical protein
MGMFSSDRTIGEYCREIWDVGPAAAENTQAAEKEKRRG